MILYILCGISGAGKSTWATNFMQNKRIAYISRDDIRFAMLGENEDYFSHEKEVFNHFVKAIAHYIPYDDVIADATHLNMFSRRKLIRALDQYTTNYKIIFVVFNTNVDTCIERNKSREGRAKIPENVIIKMCQDFRSPSLNEDERAIDIWEVNMDGSI